MATEGKNKHERPARHEQPADQASAQGRRPSSNRDWDRPSYSPFSIMRQGIDEMDRWLGQLGWGRGSTGRSFLSQVGHKLGDWTPAVEAFQRGNEFIVRVEAPGLSRQDLTVEAGDDSLTIHGERRQEREDDRDGMFWTEWSYGSFTRVIPLPPGTIADSAKASFSNGVLEVVMQAPSVEARRGRRVDISGTPPEAAEKK